MSRRGRGTSWSTPALPAAEAQARTCKYDGGSVAAAPGRNALCDSRPILALTAHKSAVEAVLAQMHAKGSTNILDLMWGWRVLSPEEPFTQGRPYGDSENNKHLILMTVGETIHQAAANHNNSIYHAFGYASNGRLGATATSTALIGQIEQQDARRLRERQGRPHHRLHHRLPARKRCQHARPAGELRLECGGRPTRRATEPPWCRPSRRLRAKSRNCESPVETRQGRRLFRRRAFVHI